MSTHTSQELSRTHTMAAEKEDEKADPPTDVVLSTEYEVTLSPEDDPQQLPLLRRWLAVVTISCASVCVTCTSSAV